MTVHIPLEKRSNIPKDGRTPEVPGFWHFINSNLSSPDAHKLFLELTGSKESNPNYHNDFEGVAGGVIQFGDTLFLAESYKSNPSVIQIIKDESALKESFRVYVCSDLDVSRFITQCRDRNAAITRTPDTEVFRQLSALVQEVYRLNSSDIHFKKTGEKTTISNRVHGDLQLLRETTRENGEIMLNALFTAATQKDGQTSDVEDFKARIENRDIRLPDGVEALRAQYMPSGFNEMTCVLRLLGVGVSHVDSMDKMGYLPSQLKVIRNIITQTEGMFLISGPTGSGKSFSLKMFLEEIARDGTKKIYTLEEPIEYSIKGDNVTQLAIQPSISREEVSQRWYTRGGSINRGDPDVIVPSEIIFPHIAAMCMQASLTGHLVLSTVHATRAWIIPDRLFGLGIKREDLISDNILKGLMSQRLVKVNCPDCKVDISEIKDLPDRLREPAEILGHHGHDLHCSGPDTASKDCPKCKGTGFIGRELVAEIIELNTDLLYTLASSDIRDRVRFKEEWQAQGGIDIQDHGLCKVMLGSIDIRSLDNCLAYQKITEKRFGFIEGLL